MTVGCHPPQAIHVLGQADYVELVINLLLCCTVHVQYIQNVDLFHQEMFSRSTTKLTVYTRQAVENS